MKNSTLTLFVLLAALFVGASAYSHRLRTERLHAERASGAFLPELNVEAIYRIEIVKGAETVTLRRDAEGFVLASHHDYPADHQKIIKLLRDCSDIEIEGRITANAGNHKTLGVDAAGPEHPDTLRVEFYDDIDNPIQGFLVGNAAESGSGYYVRKTDADEVFASAANVYVSTRPLDYVATTVLEVLRADLRSLTVTGDENFAISYDPETEGYAIAMIPPDREASATEIKSLFGALGSIAISDFHPHDDPALAGLEYSRRLQFVDKDGSQVEVQLAARDEKRYIKLGATWTKQIIFNPNDSQEVMREKEALKNKHDALQEKNRLFKSWVYEIQEYKFDQFNKAFDAIAPKKETPEVGPELPDPNPGEHQDPPNDSEPPK